MESTPNCLRSVARDDRPDRQARPRNRESCCAGEDRTGTRGARHRVERVTAQAEQRLGWNPPARSRLATKQSTSCTFRHL